MDGFIKELAEGIFAPDQVRLLTDAFDDAWSRVQASKAPWATDDYAKVGRTILAKHIITNAQSGEFDPRWLADSDVSIPTTALSLLLSAWRLPSWLPA